MSSMLIDSPGTFRPMLRLTMPVLAEQMLHLLVGFTDMWLTGNLLGDDAYVAAMSLMIYALWLIANLFAFVALGATAMTARFVGAGDFPLANRVMNQSITTGAIWTAILMVVTLPFTHQFVSFMGLTGTAAAAAEQYLFIELCVLPAVMIERVGIACLRGAGDTMSGLVVMGIVNVINMVAELLARLRHRPLPATRLARHRASAPRSATAAARRSSSRCSSAAAPATACVCATCGPTSPSSAASSASASPAASTRSP